MLKGLFRQVQLDGDLTYMPFLRASVKIGGFTSIEVDGLVDTGSALNLISISSAKTLLNKSPEEIKSGRKTSIAGLGGKSCWAYGWNAALKLRATTTSTDYVEWQDVLIYACELPLPAGQILIGQSKGLEEKILVHLNRQRKRYWLITA